MRELSQAPIVAQADDAKFFGQAKQMTYYPTGWFGRIFLKAPLLLKTSLLFEPYKYFTPDIMLSKDDSLDLKPYGIPGTIKHTPGHTAGSISVELPTKDTFVGDLIASGILMGGIIRTNNAKSPPFEDNPHTVGLALLRLVGSGMERFHMGHGGPLTATEVQRHAQALLTKKQND